MACQFKDTLHYSSPANGGRGIVRTGMLVPESVELFVCPFACGRHGSISAVKQNLKNRLSYLYVNQADIINGYDDLIIPAVGELLGTLPKRPRVVLIFVSCLDDLLGTDHEALQERLSSEFPDVKFRSCHMNPISKGSKTPPAVSIQNNIYSLMEETKEKDMGINCIGNLVPVDEKSELYAFLQHLGYDKLKHISHYETFDDYQKMAKSRFNLVIAGPGKQAAELVEKRMGMPFAFLPVSYRLEEIEESYTKMAELFTSQSAIQCTAQVSGNAASVMENDFDFTPYKQEALDAIERAKESVKDTPIIVDASAVNRPFGLARALLEHGFNVVRVQTPECVGIDKEHFTWVTEEHPEVEVVQSQHHNTVLRENQIPKSIAIGVDGAYLAGSKYVVDLFDDEGMYGYHGLQSIMEKLEHALDKEVDLEHMIHEYGLVV